MSTARALRIFYSGIGGSGMSSLAVFDSERGRIVSGSDRAFDANPHHPAYGPLRARGIDIVAQDGSGIHPSVDLLVMSTAVEDDRAEVVRARQLGVPIKTRPEYLAETVSSFRSIAVSGTSGKSTASGMLAYAMKELGMSPNFIGGARLRQFRSATNPGSSLRGDSDYLVIEACESDGSIVNYMAEHTIILNLSLDHKGVRETAGMFRALAGNTKDLVVVNADDAGLAGAGVGGNVTFSIDGDSDYRATDTALGALGSGFSVRGVRFDLRVPGRHNVYNALSCIALLSEMGVPPERIAPALGGFDGLERRFEVHLNDGGKLVVDDYAHNPHKISALIETARPLAEGICYIFQPHGFAPTKLMFEGYVEAFASGLRRSDRLVILPIYYAGGTTDTAVSAEDLAGEIRARGAAAEAAGARAEVLESVGRFQSYVVLGARDETLSDFAEEIALRLRGIR